MPHEVIKSLGPYQEHGATESPELDEAIKSLGLDEVIKSLGLDEVIKSLGLDEVIKSLGLDEAIKSLGLDEAIKSLGLDEAIKSLGLDEVIKGLHLHASYLHSYSKDSLCGNGLHLFPRPLVQVTAGRGTIHVLQICQNCLVWKPRQVQYLRRFLLL